MKIEFFFLFSFTQTYILYVVLLSCDIWLEFKRVADFQRRFSTLPYIHVFTFLQGRNNSPNCTL